MAVRAGRVLFVKFVRNYSSERGNDTIHHKLVVAGGGTGGCSVSARACRALGPGTVAVIEPAEKHYYQSMWTLVGGGIKTMDQTEIRTAEVLPKPCKLYKTRVSEFQPDRNMVVLDNGQKLTYEYLVIALGIQINPDKVDGLVDAFKNDPTVCCNYMSDTVIKTYPAIQNFKGGNAIFTFPNTPIKCGGAPQKIMYLADEYWRNHGVRDQTKIFFNTSLDVIFGVPKYAARLSEIVKRKDIQVNFRRNLTSVDHVKKLATFQRLDHDDKETYHYDFLHAVPPMSAPDVLKNSTSSIVDEGGWLDVNKLTMQHKNFPNIFGLGDCTNVPTSKTAAAVASQNKILLNSLCQVIDGKVPDGKYDGYTACPLVTGYHSCIFAEFDFDGKPLETFPIDQSKERRSMFYVKKDVMPQIYWKLLVNGKWGGPRPIRKLMHLWMSR
ncbi:sulfide:quinone oxidoreductase, mitochondrial-like [Mercenaria mercenaria]|uniref:sulfide:quinone oxidoreductase, mitochondrial-like n=1 Tax=Mercenaria mercenaria TaxID=6596 RepID=UPI00234EBE4C|nr:sulfide:quinone oxidoreductase, mitochondrial-like [Mercenaria mercenaria]XP_053398452.1 sulfide:quinone oxidoreductase, mitochondrial-like [Mercenaria mercenaria]XP_053398453.1 sulfide:quinone oxidoreductase, mitochondrial-like [Mercenaria mercenaria]XP_053398455.1 sulfide:quinone oxidoreductase, mitochondrial-like [Mercenaria mercenaria]